MANSRTPGQQLEQGCLRTPAVCAGHCCRLSGFPVLNPRHQVPARCGLEVKHDKAPSQHLTTPCSSHHHHRVEHLPQHPKIRLIDSSSTARAGFGALGLTQRAASRIGTTDGVDSSGGVGGPLARLLDNPRICYATNCTELCPMLLVPGSHRASAQNDFMMMMSSW